MSIINGCNYSSSHVQILFNSLRLNRLNRRPFADDIFKCIFLNENEWISHRTSLKFVPKVRINKIPELVHIMAWHRPGDKPLSEPMMVSLLTHIYIYIYSWKDPWYSRYGSYSLTIEMGPVNAKRVVSSGKWEWVMHIMNDGLTSIRGSIKTFYRRCWNVGLSLKYA